MRSFLWDLRDKVIGSLVQRLDNGMFHDEIGKVNQHCIFNQVERRFAATSVSADLCIWLQFRHLKEARRINAH